MIGEYADPALLDRDRPYIRLTNEPGASFHFVYLAELEPLLAGAFLKSKGSRLHRGDPIQTRMSGRLLKVVDSDGNVADASNINWTWPVETSWTDLGPCFGPQEITFTFSDKRGSRAKYGATFICPPEHGYHFETRFVSQQLQEHLSRREYGEVIAHQVAPFFLIDDLLVGFNYFLEKIGLKSKDQRDPIDSRIQSYLKRQFTAMTLYAAHTSDRDLIARRLYGISDRLHIALASIVRCLPEIAQRGNAVATDFVVTQVWNLFPADAPDPRQYEKTPQAQNRSNTDASKSPPSPEQTRNRESIQEKDRISKADDVNETGRVTVTALTSALSRKFPGVAPAESVNQIFVSSADDEATKQDIAIALRYQCPSTAESPHRWFVEMLPKALALIARQT
ncbi:MAG: hypothetical protein JNM28_12840 [Armatimonadetes bacterium]|nr:hypothetical protein [Armatimonadota bacterium]